MPEKKYLIEIPGKTGISRFNEADWASNKDAILAKYPNANVVSIDMYDATDVQDNDEYFVEIKGRDSLSRFNGADWNKHKDAILAKYPDAKVSRMRGVDYYYDQANELGEQLNAKDTEIQTWKDQQAERTGNADWSTLLMAQSGLNPIGTGLNPEKDEEIASYIAEGQKLQEERDKIKEAYDNNPRVKAAREEWEKQYAEELERYKKEYLGNLRSEIDANMESDVDIEAALKAKSAERGVWAGAGDINPYAHSTLMDGSYAEKAKLDRYQSAKYFLDKAEEAREGQLKGFWKGVGNVAENFLEEMSNRSDIATFADIFGIMKKLEKEYGTLRNVTDKEIDKSLDSSEKALLKSYFEYADALSQNSGDAAYRGGQIAGEGVKIAIEFALTGGFAGAGSAAATKGIVAGLERWAANALKGTFKAVAKNALAKVGTLATQGLAKVALATALRPSTYEHMAEATLTVDKNGHLNPVKNASLSFVDDAIETISEMSGDVIGKVLGIPFKPIKGAMGKAFNAAFGGTKFGEWAKMFVNGPVADYLKQAGFHGLPIEILEEYVGNTMRLPINPEALSEMHQDGNFLSMLLGFAPMSLLSGGVNMASFGFASKNAKESAAALYKLLTDKEFDEGRRKHLTDYKRESSPMELGLEMFDLKEELKKKGATEEELQVLADYASAVAEYQTLRGGMKEMESRERKQIFNEQKNQYGEFYQNEGDGRKVVIAQTKDGRQVFLTSERTPQGEFLAKDKMTGKEIVVKESELNPSMTVSLSMDNYLDSIIQSRREMAEFERMNNERNEQIAKVSSLLPSKLNLGTKAEPIMVVVKEKSEKGVTVVDESGKESVLPWSEVAMKMGMPITVMTDAQLAEAEAARIGLGRAEKRAERATTSAEDKSIERKVGEINNEVKEATPKPEEKYTNKETGLVDEIAFWENDPVGYCDWNDRQNNDNGEDSLDIVKSNIDTVTAEIAKIDKVKTDNPVAIKATKNERRKLQQRLDTLNALKQQYEEARTPIEQKKAEQTLLFRQRVSEWRKRFGLTEDQLVIYESLNEVESPGARMQIQRGKTEGWANINGEKGTRAFVYLPHITSMEELDATVMHEVAIHYGLHTLLGEQEYNKLMDQVWSMMSDAAKNTFIKYPGVYNIEDANARRRSAAEEFIAHVAENVSIDNATAEQKSIWQRIMDFFRNLFSDVNVNEKAIADIVKARVNAMATKGMEQQATAEATEVQQTEESNKKASEEIKENITAQASATTDANGNTIPNKKADGRDVFSTETFMPWTDNLGHEHEGTKDMVIKRMQEMQFSEQEIKQMEAKMQAAYDYMLKLQSLTNPDGSVRFEEFNEWAKKTPLYKQVGRNFVKAITSLVSNGDYPINLELTTDCIKREAFTMLLNELVKRGANLAGMGPAEIVTIQKMMKQYGIQVACALCFVEGKRLQIVNWASQIVNDWNDALIEAGVETDEMFEFGKDGDAFIPAEEWRTYEDKPALAKALRTIDEVARIFQGVDPKVYKAQKAKNEKALKKYIAEKEEAAAKKGKKWTPTDEQKREMKKIKVAGLTPTYVNENMKEYTAAFEQMRNEWVAKSPKKGPMRDPLAFTPTKGQWDELEKIRNKQIENVKQKMVRLIMEYPEMRKKMTLNDLLGSKGLMEIRQQHGAAYEQLYSIILQRFGTGTPKPVQDAVPYDGEVMTLTESAFKAANKIGGARLFSFSDFDITKVFDYMQMFFDLEANRQMLQSYTKEVAAILLFGRSNAKFNISTLASAVVPAEVMEEYESASEGKRKELRHKWAENAGLLVDENGNITGISFSEEHSVSPEFAQQIFHDDSRNKDCGAIMVGASVNHAIFSAAQDWIRMVIPFHLSGMPIAARDKTDVKWWTDNTEYQSTRKRTSDGWSKISDKENTFEFYADMHQEGWNMRDKAREYIDWCKSNAYRPKFDWGINSDYYRAYCEENGYTPNQQIIDMMDADTTNGVWNQYYKFLTDFTAYKPVFNEEGEMIDETPSPQQRVVSNFDMSEMEKQVIFEGENSMLERREGNIELANQHLAELADKVVPYLNGTISEEEMDLRDDVFYDARKDANAYLEAKAEEGTLMWSTSIESRRILDEYTGNQELVDMVKAAIENGVIQSSVLADNINEYEKEIAEGAERGDRWVDTESIINRIINNLETLAEGVVLQNAIPAINNAQAKVNSIAKQMKDKYGMESMDQWEPEDKKTYLDAVDALINTSNDRLMFSTEAHGGLKLSSSNRSIAMFDKVNGTDVKGFFDFLNNNKKPLPGGPNVFHIANAGELLNKYGIKGKFMAGQFTFSATHTKDSDHQLGVKEWVDVINNLNSPLAITSYLGRENEYRIYTYAVIDGNSICLGVSVSKKDDSIELSNIITAFGRDVENLLKGEKIYLLYPETIGELKQNIDELKQKISQVSTTPNPWLNATSSALTEGKGTNNSETSNKKDGKDLFSTSINEAESPKIDASSNEQAEGNYFFKTSNNALVGLHNITEDKLRKAFKQGGLANPSTAVVNITEYALDGYGEISLVMPQSLIDAKSGNNSGTYTGDAWTPVYPPIIKQLDDKGWKVIKDKIAQALGEGSELSSDIINGMRHFLENNTYSRMEIIFLKERGIEIPMQYKNAEGYVGKRRLEIDLGIENINGGWEAYEQYKNANPSAKFVFNLWLQVGGKTEERKKLREMVKKEPKLIDILGLKDDVSFAMFDSFAYDILKKQQDAGRIDSDSTLLAATQYVDKNNLRAEYDQWLESLLNEAGATEVFFAGYNRDGNRIYKKNTLENVSRYMKQQEKVNSYNNGGLSATKSVLLQRMTSLSQIKKNEAKLQSEAAYNKEYDALNDRLFNLISSLADMQEISSNRFMNLDYAEKRLQDAITKKNPIAYLNKEYGYEIESNGEFAEELQSFVKDVKAMPAKYFETKFDRPVYINEFAAAVVPSGISEDVLNELREAGLPIYEYDSQVEGARREAIEQSAKEEKTFFSTKLPQEFTKQFMQNAVNEFYSEFNTFAPATVVYANSRRMVAEALGLTQDAMPDSLYNEVRAEAKKSGAFLANVGIAKKDGTEDVIRRILIFANDNINVSSDVDRIVIHENTHVLVQDNPELLELGKWLIQSDNKTAQRVTEWAKNNYKEENWANEVLCDFVGRMLSIGKGQMAMDIVPEEYKPLLNYIYEKFGYRPDEEDGRRSDTAHADFERVQMRNSELGEADNNQGIRFKSAITPEVRREMDVISAQAIVNGNYLKAPNGKDTNLTPEQWALVRTQNFKRRFGDWENDPENASKVVDENGEPKVVYHGSPREGITKFAQNEAQGWGKGSYFTDNKTQAEEEFGDNVYEVFLNLRSPYTDKSRLSEGEIAKTKAAQSMIDEYGDHPDFIEEFDENGRFANEVLRELGYDGVAYPGSNSIDGIEYVAFAPNQIKSATENNGEYSESEDIRFSTSNRNQAIFVSNAAKAVEGIKMEKATPEQWLKMIEKNGGLKAGEDKWMGLSDWLKASDKKTLTKDEVMQFINDNMIVIEEVQYKQYAEEIVAEQHREMEKVLQEKFDAYQTEYHEQTGYSDFSGAANDYAIEKLRKEMSDTFPYTIENSNSMVYLTFPYEEDSEMRKWSDKLGVPYTPINQISDVRLSYTTDGLGNKQEIALTIPTIESWGKRDLTHFGDAGNGRAVAWVRFGDTWKFAETTEEGKKLLAYVNQLREKYGIEEEAEMTQFGNINLPDDLVDAITNEELYEYQRLSQESISATDKTEQRILVIDEIQSKRHQEGREKGYKSDFKNSKEAQRLKAEVDRVTARLLELEKDRRENSDAEQTELARLDIMLNEAQSNAEYDAILAEQDKIKAHIENRESEILAVRSERRELDYQWNKQVERDAVSAISAIPDAPFEKNWSELAMKRMLRYAAENGYDVVAWTKGEQQAERYNIGHTVASVDYRLNDDGTYRIDTMSHSGYQIESVPTTFSSEQEISEIFGKDIARKIVGNLEEKKRIIEESKQAKAELKERRKREGFSVDSPEYDAYVEEFAKIDARETEARKGYTLSETDFRIGGEGMKGFYDKMLPAFMNKYGKKWGVKVEDINLPHLEDGLTMHSVPVTEEMKQSVMEGQVMFRTAIGGNKGYVGYSMSKRAASARTEGRYPKTDFKKEYGISQTTLDALVNFDIIDNSEWHHTSKYGNKTTFYGWYEDSYADIYAAYKKEVDALAEEYKTLVDDHKAYPSQLYQRLASGEITPQEEIELGVQADKEYNQKVDEIRTKIDAIFNGEKNGTDGDILFKTRTKPAPTKTQEVYKLMRLGVDGKLYPLFIGSADAIDLGVWYDADSPNLGDLTKLASGVHLVNNETGEAITLDQFKAEHPEIAIKGEKPNVAAINWATENGMRWISIEDKATAQKRYEGESRSYYNFGINGSGQVGLFAMRPGWHAGSLPTMRQIGKGKDKNLRDDSFVWVRGRVPADVDYQAEADANPDKDIPTHIPTDGFYMKATNANKKASQADKMGWYVAGSFIADEIISDAEARRVIDEWNAEHPDAKVEYDYARESGKEFDPARGGLVESENVRFKTEINPSEMDVDQLVANGRMKLSSENQDAANILFEKISAINGNVQQLVRAAAAQKDYDKKTVKAIIDQATTLLDAGRLNDLTRGEIKRLLGAINSATGKADLTAAFDRLMNIMISNQLRAGKENIDKMLRIRGKKVNAQGVEARGRMDIEGQQIMDAIRENIALSLAEIDERIAMLQDKLSSPSDSIRREAENEYVGLEFARQYVESIGNSEAEERALRKEKVEAEADYRQGVITRKEFNEFAKTIEDAIRDNRIQRVLSYQRLAADMAKMVTKSIEQAGQLREAEKQRVQKIQHFANSDMQGMPADAHTESENKFWNNPLVSLFTSPLATFEQWLRVFGAKSAEGKGYLYNHFMTAWNNANNQEYLGMKEANERLNAKAQEVFGDVVKRWSDIFSIDKKLPTLTIEWYDDGEMKQYEVSQGNLLYIYMVNKMIDGKMKLRRMGISEADVQEIEKHLDPRYIEIADWIQNEFLPSIRDKYNAVHERLFGAPMASIDNYFPIKVLANARVREVEVGTPESNSKPSTITGSIIKRTKNSLALDILHSNAFDVVLEHIEQMEHWAAFAEFNQDLNTLLSYKKFRNRVQNMSGALGSGKEAWKSFKETAEIAAGVYQPKTTKADKALNTMAKGLTAGKINFRLWTAIKQILSMPAFLPYVNPTIMAKTMATPWEAWNWAMNELPAFEKRWGGRKAGNIRLEKNEADIDSWLNNAMEVISRAGMTPNAFVDAVTCSIGARAVYQTQMERYLKEGYSEEKASEKAKLDATVAFNATQQSSEGAFVSTIQSDRTIIAYVLTVFRNNSFGMQREMVDAIRNTKKRMQKGFKEESIEFMKKQMIRDGLTEEQAERAATRIYRNSAFKDAARMATFGFLMQFLWTLGGNALYLLFGDDDKEKEEMLKDAMIKGAFGSIEGLGFGNIVTEAIAAAIKGDLKSYRPSFSPAGADLENLWNKFNSDWVTGANELVNIVTQMCVGVNPQIITDTALMIYDACDGDIETSKEVGIALLRLLQAPQSNIDKLKMDEIDFTKDLGLDWTIEKFARKHAEYKKLRNAGLFTLAYPDEAERKAEDKYIKRFLKDAEEKKRTSGNELAKAYYEFLDTDYKVIDATIKEYRKAIKEAEKNGYEDIANRKEDILQNYLESIRGQMYREANEAEKAKKKRDNGPQSEYWENEQEWLKKRREALMNIYKLGWRPESKD